MKNKTIAPEVEQYVTERTDIITQTVVINAEADGKACLPPENPSAENPSAYFREYHHEFQGVIDTVNAKLNIAGKCFSVSQLRIAYEDGKRARVNAQRVVKEKIANLSAKVKGLGLLEKWKKIGLTVFSLTAMLGDCIYARPFFEHLGLKFFESVVFSVIAGATIGGICHFLVPRFIDAAKDIKTKNIRTALVLGGFFFLFLVMGWGRAENLAHGGEIRYSAIIMFALFSMVLCLFSIYIGQFIYQKEIGKDAAKATIAALLEAKKELAAIEKEDRDEEIAYRSKVDEAAEILNYGSSLIASVIHAAHAAYYRYAKTNMMYRNDGIRPVAFDLDYPFQFQTYTEPILKKEGHTNSGTMISMLLVAACGLLASCNENPEPDTGNTTAVTVFVDYSDPLSLRPSGSDLFHHAGLDADIWQGVRFKITGLGDKDHMPSHVLELPAESRYAGNIDDREARVGRFHVALDSLVAAVGPTDTSRLDYSIIYRPIAREAMELKNSGYGRKEILVYSDLMQRDDEVDFYSPAGWNLLAEFPDSLNGIFFNQVPVAYGMEGLSIRFLYNPPDFEGNNLYRRCSAFFAAYFSRYGAKTSVGTTLE